MKRGQSILEYVIILTVVVGIVILAITQFLFKPDSNRGMGKIINNTAGAASNLTGKIGQLAD